MSFTMSKLNGGTKKDGKIHINGTKTWVTSGENSDGFIVVCKNEDPSPENKQMSMYLVPANAKGVTSSR